MPIKSNNPFEDGRALYERMVKELIVDIPIGGGMYRPQLNLSGLVKLVLEQPKAAQVATQMLAEANEDKAVAQLHGTWLMMALIAAFGEEDTSVQLTRKMAPDFYESAVLQLREQFGS